MCIKHINVAQFIVNKRKQKQASQQAVVNAFLLNNWMCDMNMIENVYYCSGYENNFSREQKKSIDFCFL